MLMLNLTVWYYVFFPAGSAMKNLSASAGDAGSIPGLGRSHGGGHGNPLQCSCLGNIMDTGAWRATVHGAAKNRTRLSTDETCSGHLHLSHAFL